MDYPAGVADGYIGEPTVAQNKERMEKLFFKGGSGKEREFVCVGGFGGEPFGDVGEDFFTGVSAEDDVVVAVVGAVAVDTAEDAELFVF